jgi:NADH-ubiquinone oxidoreductase chain 1
MCSYLIIHLHLLESELVAGFMTEHSAVIFVFFFLAEYSNIILISTLTTILFLGGYLLPSIPFFSSWLEATSVGGVTSLVRFTSMPLVDGAINGLVLGLKATAVVFLFIWVRASFPRIRYDQLLQVCWMVLLPLVFAIIILVPCIIYSFDLLPFNTI